MSPLRSPSRCQSRSTGTSLLVGLAVLAACEQPPTDPINDLEPRMASVALTSPFTIRVLDGPKGNPVQGAVARLIDGAGNALTLPPTGADGVASINALEDSYCVSVRMAPPSAMELSVIAPASVPAELANELPLRSDLAPVLLLAKGVATWTAGGWLECLTNPPVDHGGKGTSRDVALPPSYQAQLELLGPGGQPLSGAGLTQVVGYAVSPVNTQGLRPPGVLFDPGLQDGFLQFVALATPASSTPNVSSNAPAATTSSSALVFGVAPNQSFLIEFQQSGIVNGQTVNFTATLGPFAAGDGGPTVNPLPQLFATPLTCVLQLTPGGGLQTIVSATAGYGATLRDANLPDLTRLLLADLTTVTLQVVVRDDREFTVTFREKGPGGQVTTQLSFHCLDGVCVTSKGPRTSGQGNHQVVAFYRTLDSSTETALATFFLKGLAPNHEQVTYDVKTQGSDEALPDRSRDDDESAHILIEKPSGDSCPLKTSSDDKWFIGIA